MAENVLQKKFDLTARQLERMRSMQYAYHQKFFNWLLILLLLLVFLGVWGGTVGRLILPFLVVTGGVLASFYLHFCDFARVHATALEKKLNHLLGSEELLGGTIESMYFYPIDSPKLSGWVPSKPFRFFSAFTLHWSVLWFAVWVLGAWIGYNQLNNPYHLVYLIGLVIWSSANAIYLAYYFLNANDLRNVSSYLNRTFNLEPAAS